MPGDPRECRKHAVRCAQLATEAKTEQLKAHLLSLSRAWEKLAVDIEFAQRLLGDPGENPPHPER